MRRQTLLGIAPEHLRKPPPAAATTRAANAPDDLDWELPPSVQAAANALEVGPDPVPAPSPKPRAEVAARPDPASAKAGGGEQARDQDDPLPVDVEELPPESKPSGIGQTYKPRDEGAPAVVLTEDVQRTEAEARAKIEAQHRARSAPTIARMPAVRAAAIPDSGDTVPGFRSRRRLGLWLTLIPVAIAVAAGAVALLRSEPAEEAELNEPAGPPPVAADLAPAPPAPTPEPAPPPPEPAASAVPEPIPEPSAEPPAEAKRAEQVEATREPTSTPVKRPAPVAARTLKPKPTAPKPPSTTKSGSKGSGVIVRDNPF
jgi:hypothetical protein